MTSITLDEWTNFLYVPVYDLLNGPTNNYLYNLRMKSSEISFENMNIDPIEQVEEPKVIINNFINVEIYNDSNNKFNLLMNAW